jgi:hypothetical protein
MGAMTRRSSPLDPLADHLRFELADHAVVVRRPTAELQVGLDPRRALVFADGYRPVLDRLATAATRADLLATGQATGLSTGEVTGAVRQLDAAGLLRRAAAGPVVPAGARVRLIGAGPVGLPLARYLVEGGVAELAVFDSRPPDRDLYPNSRGFSHQAAALAATLAGGPARIVAQDHWSKPETLVVDLTVVVSEGPEVDRVITDHLLRLDQPHLLVRSLGDAVWVGPLVLPGRTPCLRCTDLVRTDADPGWPAVLAQLGRLRLPLPGLLSGWAASVAAAQTLAFLGGGRPETTGATLELTAADLRTELRAWPSHAECGCRWQASTEWAP